jgi:hypothetical protein
MKKLLIVGIVLVSFIFALNLYASEYWGSTFDLDDENWGIWLAGPVDETFDPVYVFDNDQGYICYSPSGTPPPPTWIFLQWDWQDWSAVYGGTISFDIKVSGEGEPHPYYAHNKTVVIDLPGELGTHFYSNIQLTPEKDVWTTYEVPILDEVFTRAGDPTVKLSDELENLIGLDIRGDLLEGPETTCIDNVKIYLPDILDSVEDFIETGDLVGTGKGRSADGLIGAFTNMLQNAIDLFNAGDISGACDQLDSAYRKCDGLLHPPDFVEGDAAEDVRLMIESLMAAYQCE